MILILEYNCCSFPICNLPPQMWNKWASSSTGGTEIWIIFAFPPLFLFYLIHVFNIIMHHSHTGLLLGELYFIYVYYRKSFKQNCYLNNKSSKSRRWNMTDISTICQIFPAFHHLAVSGPLMDDAVGKVGHL